MQKLSDGTWNDHQIYLQGNDLDEDQVRLIEGQEFPQMTIEDRLRLLCYYSKRDATSWLQHACWVLDHRPLDWVADHMAIPTSLNAAEIQKLLECVVNRVKRFHDNPAVLGGAGEFVVKLDWQLCLTWLEQAARLDLPNPHWANRLFYVYLALSKKDLDTDAFYRLACEQANYLLQIQDNEAELCEMLSCLAKYSINIGDYEKASILAKEGAKIAIEKSLLPFEHKKFQDILESIPVAE